MATILVTGCARGLGLEFARRYSERGDTVLATARRISPGLQALEGDRCRLFTLDVDDDDSIARARTEIGAQHPSIDFLINNAGIKHGPTWESSENWGTLTGAGLERVLRTNLVSPTLVTQAFLDLLGPGSRVAAISSAYSWMTNRPKEFANNFGYSYSKAGINLLMRNLGFLLHERGIIAISLDPGWARTDMGGPDAFLSPEESVTGMIAALDGTTIENSGAYLSWEGERLAY